MFLHTQCGNCKNKIGRNSPVGKNEIPVCSLTCGKAIIEGRIK